jgi:breakpoint cluster region protein
MLADADIHVVAGVLKLYFRELPEPLFTEESYTKFVDSLG